MIELLNPVDVYVGGRVRATRAFRNMEHWELASSVGISPSRLTEYEAGKVRCLPEHLAAIADSLNVRGAFFFQGMRERPSRVELAFGRQISQFPHVINDNIDFAENDAASETAGTCGLKNHRFP